MSTVERLEELYNGYWATLSDKEQTAVKSLQGRVKDVWIEDCKYPHFMRTWLVARHYNMNEAEKMLRNHIKWLKKEPNSLIYVNYDRPDILAKYQPGSFCGHDKLGRPIFIEMGGRTDLQGIMKSVTKLQWQRDRMWLNEHIKQTLLPKRCLIEGRVVEGITVIYDMEQFGLKNLWKPGLEVVLETLKMAEDNYPEVMSKCFIVNANRVFPIAYRVIKLFLSQDTQDKLVVLAAGQTKELLNYISPENLPARYGGEMRDPDGNGDCVSSICYGGEVPSECYLSNTSADMNIVKVAPHSSNSIVIKVDNPNTVLLYEFYSKKSDIKFGIFFNKNQLPNAVNLKTKDMESVMETTKVNCHLATEKGDYVCEKPGEYVVVFENTHAVVTKKILYSFDIIDDMGIS